MRNARWFAWFVFASILAIGGARGARLLTTHLIVAIDHYGDAAVAIQKTADQLNGKHGTIAMLNEDVGATKSLIIHADLVARHEQQSMNVWDADASTLFRNLNGGIVNLNGGVTDLRGTINAVPPVLAATTAAIKTVDETAKSVNTLVSDPHIAGTVAHVDAAAGNVEDMSADAKAKVHSILHPKWWVQAINVAERVAVDVGRCIF